MGNIEENILKKLREIEKKEHIRILLAVESGSRAWGFASNDSDYDVRFIYVRETKDYLKLEEQRDVIEWELDDVYDINGWDIRKAMVQFRRGNATLFEWSNSPIVYLKTSEWDKIYEVAKEYHSAKTGLNHYYHMAKNTYEVYLQGNSVMYKKYFYALRPLLACRYILEKKCPPPVLFENLLEGISRDMKVEIEKLIEIKVKTDEKELNPQLPAIISFIKNELVTLEPLVASETDDHIKEWNRLNKAFLELIGM